MRFLSFFKNNYSVMSKLTLLLVLVSVLSSCASVRLSTPKTSYRTLEDNNFPCLTIEYPDTVEFKGSQIMGDKNVDVLKYYTKYAGYEANIIKFYSNGTNISDLNIDDQYSNSAIIYRENPGSTSGKSGVLVVNNEKENFYLVGNVLFFPKKGLAVNVELKKFVSSSSVFNVEDWKETTSGQRTIDEMKGQLDFFYHSIKLRDCRNISKLRSTDYNN